MTAVRYIIATHGWIIRHIIIYSAQIKGVESDARTGTFTFKKFSDQPTEAFSSSVAYSTLTARCYMETEGGGGDTEKGT